MLEKIFGKGSVSRTIGTRTNVVRFPKGKQPIDPTRGEFDVEGTAVKNPDLVQTIENSIEDRMGDITKMNDQELLTYTSNVRRLLNFKEPPIQNADVIKFGSGEEIKGKGLEELIEKQGVKNPPTTVAGQLETTGKRLEQLGKDFAKEFDAESIAKQEADRQAMIARQYEGKGYAGGVFGPSGMYRAVARDFLLDQHAKGKIKLDPGTLKNLEERNYISGGQPLMYADPIRIMRYHYGDDVFEKIPLDKIPTGARSEILDVMSKVEAPPIKTEAPKTPGGYLTPGEYRANIEEMQKIEDMIKRRESRFADMTEEEIQNELAQYGGKRSSFEMGLEYDYPEEYAKYKTPKKPEPEEKADGGIIGYAMGGRIGFAEGTPMSGLVYVGSWEGPWTGPEFLGGPRKGQYYNSSKNSLTAITGPDGAIPRPGMPITTIQSPQQSETISTSEIPLTVQERYKKYLSAAGSGTGDELYKLYRANLDKKSDGGRIGFNKGKRVKSSIDKLIEQLNKKTKGKKSMESVDPKTGEVTVPKKPIRKAEEPTGMTTMDPEPEIVDEKSIKGGFDFNDSEIKAQMEKAMQEGNKRSKEMRAMGLDPAKSKDYDEYIKIKEASGDKDFNKYFDDLEIKTKFKGVISDDLLNQILIDDNPQRKAEVIATIEQGLKMQEKGMDPQEIVDILKNTTRTKQAKGGSVGLNYLMGF